MTQLNLTKYELQNTKMTLLSGAIAIACAFNLAQANPSEQSLQGRKVYLEEQLKDLEAKERTKQEIETLESKIQFLKEKQGLVPQQQQIQTPQTQESSIATNPAQADTASSQPNTLESALEEQAISQEEQIQTIPYEPMNKEKSGFFIGLQAGVASFGADFGAGYYGSKKGNTNLEFTSASSINQAEGMYGINIGFKHGITGGFGLRYYADINYAYEPKYKIWSMSYGFNIDGLLNIAERNNNFFGFFGGVGIGAQTHGWANKVLEDALYTAGEYAGKTNDVTMQGNPTNHRNRKFKNPITTLNVAINFGIRGNIAKHHDIELGVRFRPMRSKLIEEKMETSIDNQTVNTTKFGISGKIGSPYDIFLRYNYVF